MQGAKRPYENGGGVACVRARAQACCQISLTVSLRAAAGNELVKRQRPDGEALVQVQQRPAAPDVSHCCS